MKHTRFFGATIATLLLLGIGCTTPTPTASPTPPVASPTTPPSSTTTETTPTPPDPVLAPQNIVAPPKPAPKAYALLSCPAISPATPLTTWRLYYRVFDAQTQTATAMTAQLNNEGKLETADSPLFLTYLNERGGANFTYIANTQGTRIARLGPTPDQTTSIDVGSDTTTFKKAIAIPLKDGYVNSLSWSPDGSRLIYLVSIGGTKFGPDSTEVRSVCADGSHAQTIAKITDGGGWFRVGGWSDSDTIVYEAGVGTTFGPQYDANNRVAVHLTTGNVTKETAETISYVQPGDPYSFISPDGLVAINKEILNTDANKSVWPLFWMRE